MIRKLTLAACCLMLAIWYGGCGGNAQHPEAVTQPGSTVIPGMEQDSVRLTASAGPAPVEFSGAVDGDELTLEWNRWLPGDYNNDLVVEGKDLFPLASRFGEESNWNGHTETTPGNDCIDGNRDGLLNGMDVFPIAVQFQQRIDGWNVWSAFAAGSPFDTSDNDSPIAPTGSACLDAQQWVYPGTGWTDRLFLMKSWEEASDTEGAPSEIWAPEGVGVPVSIEALPATYEMAVDEQVDIQVTVFLSEGLPLNISYACNYEVDNGEIIEVDEQGRVTALAEGTATVDVTYAGFSDQSEFTVVAPTGWTTEIIADYDIELSGHRMYIDDEGNPAVFYGLYDWDSDETALMFARREGGVWQVETVHDWGSMGYDPQVAPAPGGMDSALHFELGMLDAPLHYTWYEGGWQDEQVDDEAVPNFLTRGYSLDYLSGNAVAAYSTYDWDTDDETVRVATRTAPGTWSVEDIDTTFGAEYLSMIVDESTDTIHVFYVPNDWENVVDWVVHAWKTGAAAWEFEDVVSGENDWPQGLSSIMTPDNRPLVMYDYGSNTSEQWYAIKETGGWENAMLAAPGHWGWAAFDPLTGQLAVSYWEESPDKLRFTQENGEGGWSSLTVESGGSDLSLDGNLVFQDDGTAWIAYWLYDDQDHMMAARRDP